RPTNSPPSEGCPKGGVVQPPNSASFKANDMQQARKADEAALGVNQPTRKHDTLQLGHRYLYDHFNQFKRHQCQAT
ncbi:hypothetical protein K3217_08945, partial [bacterium BD-1]|nr:hypothetical protein [Ottowia caeni]